MNRNQFLAFIVLTGTQLSGLLRGQPSPETNDQYIVLAGERAPDAPRPEGETLETRPRINPDLHPAFAGQTRAPAVRTTTPLDIRVVASGLSRPWGITFLPDGKILFTEKTGNMRLMTADGVVGDPILNMPAVINRGVGGMLDVAADPEFSTNRKIWYTYAATGEAGNAATVATARLSDDGKALEDQKIVLQTPFYVTNSNYGIRLLFTPDSKLFVCLGDRFENRLRLQAQNLDSLLGKVLRLNADGSIPADNPFVKVSGARGEIWTFGHRDPQSLAWNAETRTVWSVEHGPQGGDEVNHLRPGANYGWPLVSYGKDYTGPIINQGKTQWEGTEQPAYYWDPVVAPGGATFYFGNQISEWNGNLFVAALAGEHVARLVFENGKVVGEERLLQDQHQRIRNVKQGPDGALWVLTDSIDGRIIRIARKTP